MSDTMSGTEKPLIEITSCPVATTNKKMVIAGMINSEEPGLQLFINSEEQKIHNGRFMVSLPLDDGANEFDIVLANDIETLAREKRSIFCGFLPPVLKIDDIPTVTAAKEITLTGSGHDINQHKSLLTLKINKEVIEIAPDGTWSKTFNLEQGTNQFDILLYDGALRKAVMRRLVSHHPKAPELKLEGLGVITSRKVELNGTLENFDYNKMDLKIHNKIVPVVDNAFKYMTSVRTDVAEIPFSIDWGGRQILSFSGQVVFLPSPPTVMIDEEIKQISPTHCRITGTISDENDIDPKIYVNNKEVFPRAGIWTATLQLEIGINTVIVEGKNQSGLSKTIKKKIIVPE
ncbi:MAG: hypothetical protein FWG91_04165 [Lachnospiraceae bacterium]|nr:hypothetical protein [Lachnospiraceae bacterium]